MAYFDFVMSEIHGLRIKELVDHKAAGGTVIGTFCLYVPEEIIRALGGLSVGLCAGAEWAYDEVDRLLPTNTCALIKSFMGFKLGKVCPYVETFAFMNRGVFLTLDDSPVLESLRTIAKAGSRFLSCGTCLDYYEVKDRLAVGEVGTMPLVQELMQAADKVITV